MDTKQKLDSTSPKKGAKEAKVSKQTKAKPKQTKAKLEQIKAKPKQTKAKPEQIKAKPKQTKAKLKQTKEGDSVKRLFSENASSRSTQGITSGELRKRGLWGATLAVLLYMLTFVVLMFCISIDQPVVEEPSFFSGAILVSFGEDSAGSGEAALGGSKKAILTQKSSPVKMTTSEGRQPVERVVNSRALFPGAQSTSHNLNQGKSTNDNGAKNVVNDGKPLQPMDGSSRDALSGEYLLDGRQLVGDLPLPDYDTDLTGRVVINITVNEKGVVTLARFEPKGSTTNSSILIDAAREAASQARFTSSSEFAVTGTITYLFMMY